MKIFVNVKQAGKRRNYITKEEIDLKTYPSTLQGLISEIVRQNVKDFNKKGEEKILNYLTNDEINERLSVGRVSFGEKYNPNRTDLDKALECAFLAYEDGIFRVFIGERETENLDSPIDLTEGDVLTFVRLTMLAGRMW